MTQKINFGEIWLADLTPRTGTELGKTRPVLIIQNQTLLEINHPSTLIIPLTTNLIPNSEPLRIRLKAIDLLEKDSDLLIDQVRAIDNHRFIKGPFTKFSEKFMKKVQSAVMEIIGYEIDERN